MSHACRGGGEKIFHHEEFIHPQMTQISTD